MSNLYALNKQFRAELLAKESQAAGQMVHIYGEAYTVIREALDQLMERMEQAQDDGTYSPAWLYEEKRLDSLLVQVEKQIGFFAEFVEGYITTAQADAAIAGQHHARQMILAEIDAVPSGSFLLLHTAAVEDLAGFLSDGSPLSSLLDTLAGQASAGVKKALTNGASIDSSGPHWDRRSAGL